MTRPLIHRWHERRRLEHLVAAAPLLSVVPYVQGGAVQAYDVSPDDKRFLFLRETAPSDRSDLIVVQNWTEELKQRSRK